ncbi:MAG: hypothetical protein Q8Q95_00485 [bacterium]|nr:hypothetical protein [bacterium]
MKRQKYFNFLLSTTIVCSALAVSYFIVIDSVSAQEISYPVKELGSCKNEAECKTFCDNKDNITSCVNFAEKNGLMSAEDANQARKFAKIGAGPGGCKSQNECESYCEDISRIDTCLDFASKNGFISAEELAEAQKVAQALKSGASLPGGCKNKAECESFCNDLDNAGECFDFAEKAGFIPPDEIDDARKAVEAMKKGARPPGGCKNKKECENYCSDPNNIEQCFDFAEKAGFIPKEEIEQARKIIPLMKAGKMPGGCKGKQECESYCQDDSHIEECGNFAVEAGFMKPEEVEMFKKTGGKGPGGCKGKNECESFCNDPVNQEQCFKFASEKGLIPEAQVKEMKEGMAQFQQGLGIATPEVLECIKSSVGENRFEKMKSGGIPDKSVGEAMGQCFSKLMKPPAGFEGGAPAGFEGQSGPPSAEDIQKMIPKGVDVSPEMLKKGPPSAEDIQKMLPKGVEVTPEMMKNGPPSQEQIQNIIQQKVKEQMEKSGAPSGGSFGPPASTQFGPPAGTQFGPPAGIPTGPPAGF